MPTNRNHLQCAICGTKIITRVSLVYEPYREFAFPCPKCAVEIRLGVEVIVPSEKDVKDWQEMTNLPEELFAPAVTYPKLLNAKWINQDLSSEEWDKADNSIDNVVMLDDTFLVPLPIDRHFSSFTIAFGVMGEAIQEYQRNNFIRRKAASEFWPALEQLILHFNRRQFSLFDRQFTKLFHSKAPDSISGKALILHERIEKYGLLFCKDDSLHTTIKQRLRQAEISSKAETTKLVNYYKARKKDEDIEKQLHDIRRRWAKLFSALAALYTIHYWADPNRKLAGFTLAQKRFDELKSLYVDCFETFCRISVIAAAVEGIIAVGRAIVPKARGEFTIEEFDLFKNGSKPDILKRLGPPTSDLFVPYIDHRLRNGIGHNSARYDVVSDAVHYVIENERGATTYTIPYISFCESMFNLYIQLETVSLYLNWVRLYFNPKDGGKSLFSTV